MPLRKRTFPKGSGWSFVATGSMLGSLKELRQLPMSTHVWERHIDPMANVSSSAPTDVIRDFIAGSTCIAPRTPAWASRLTSSASTRSVTASKSSFIARVSCTSHRPVAAKRSSPRSFISDRFRRDGISYLLSTIPAVRDRARRVEFTTPVLAASPLGLRVPRIVDRGLLLIGDAAGAPDPITGDGIAMAMASVMPAADAIVSGDLGSYERVRLAMGRNADRLGRLLLAVSRAKGPAALMLLRKRSLVTRCSTWRLGVEI